MAKIRLNKLPGGFEVKNGKVVKKLQQGGMTTGDQFDYSLVTGGYKYGGNTFNTDKDVSVRYSLSSVPREVANLEAEGGETVLTDLNDDGKFGLYNITGPRHSQGGVPMYLPEQSFVFSDTKAMKFNKNELAEFGVESRKGMTPADVSKKFQLNEFIGAMADPFVDDIQLKSAELMRDKNQMSLSKLAFGQEQKKQFRDGVPVTAHPYLMSQGIDPIEFTQKVERITAEQAAEKMFEALPPNQRAQVMALREMMGNAEQQQAKYGLEKYQNLGETNEVKLFNPSPSSADLIGYNFPLFDAAMGKNQPWFNWDLNNNNIPDWLERVESTNQSDQPAVTSEEKADASRNNNTDKPADKSKSKGKSKSNNDKTKVALDEEYNAYLEKEYGFSIPTDKINVINYRPKQRFDKETGNYGDAQDNLEGWLSNWSSRYGEEKMQELLDSRKDYPAGVRNPKIAAFQTWVNKEHIPTTVAAIQQERIDKGYEPLNEDQLANLQKDFIDKFGFPGADGTAEGVDGRLGTFTTSRLPINYDLPEKEKEKEKEEVKDLDDPNIPYEVAKPELDFYTQDLYKGAAIAMRDRDMFMPFRRELERPRVDYVLNDPTREIANINEQFSIASNVLGAFGGRQGLDASLSKQTGTAMTKAANVFAKNKAFNINTINRGKMVKGQFDAKFELEDATRDDFEYDATQATLQQRLNERNADNADFADWQADALTNAVGAYNLSSLYDQFNIDPIRGGAIDFTDGRPLTGSKKQNAEAIRQQRLKDMQTLYNQFGKDGVTKDMLKYYTEGIVQDDSPSGNRANMYGIDPEMLAQINAASGRAKKGTEIKPYALPFYTGKTI
jgi:hypothetical protein